MYEQVEKPKENKSRAISNFVSQKKSNEKQGFGFVDNRPEAAHQHNLQKMAANASNSNKELQPIVDTRSIPSSDNGVIQGMFYEKDAETGEMIWHWDPVVNMIWQKKMNGDTQETYKGYGVWERKINADSGERMSFSDYLQHHSKTIVAAAPNIALGYFILTALESIPGAVAQEIFVQSNSTNATAIAIANSSDLSLASMFLNATILNAAMLGYLAQHYAMTRASDNATILRINAPLRDFVGDDLFERHFQLAEVTEYDEVIVSDQVDLRNEDESSSEESHETHGTEIDTPVPIDGSTVVFKNWILNEVKEHYDGSEEDVLWWLHEKHPGKFEFSGADVMRTENYKFFIKEDPYGVRYAGSLAVKRVIKEYSLTRIVGPEKTQLNLAGKSFVLVEGLPLAEKEQRDAADWDQPDSKLLSEVGFVILKGGIGDLASINVRKLKGDVDPPLYALADPGGSFVDDPREIMEGETDEEMRKRKLQHLKQNYQNFLEGLGQYASVLKPADNILEIVLEKPEDLLK
ncbi:hypothetical protein [Leptothoe spongobia]|uniref:Uncharacterized protein n=1 Tax=Leptothoe spongobia TAU-MAC 1115 TaxID=1967444 RepID=A0A947GGR4_9CYAN|nr:hypothetical protein [Leptothoe spongobia]MBT9314499.1 hypothetical protein [Leptothoe spongobia TAU-MAC 1115]